MRKLPGVGPYTAAAVASIAFDRRAFALDGNGLRVLARLYAERAPVNRPATRARLHALGLALVPADRAGDFNQAMMELGALVCGPRAPACADCPVRAHCVARAAGMPVDELPVKEARPARQPIRIACAVVQRRGRVLLVRRRSGELLAGTWALPSAVVRDGANPGDCARAAARAAGITDAGAVARGTVRHVFTHRDLTAEVFTVSEGGATRLRDAPAPPGREQQAQRRWLDARQLGGNGTVGISSFTRKTLAAAGLATIAQKRDSAPDSA